MPGIGALRARTAGPSDEGPQRSRSLSQGGQAVEVALKRVYEAPAATDGYRILVERLWPRGVSKEKARIDLWLKEAAPSHELRRWFDHEPAKWLEFKRRYFEELGTRAEAVVQLRERLEAGKVTFVFASRELRFNNAVALKEFMAGKA